jgi:alpha-2-macroglobulin
MFSARAAVFVTLGAILASAEPLHVLRVSPDREGDAGAAITVTFDRPVASGLDQSVDPATIFAIAPRVAGRLEWRDPVTIRLTPAAPLQAGTTYIVTIANGFQALDGSRLDAPYHFSFRVRGPEVQDVSPSNGSKYLTPTTRIKLLLGGPADVSLLESMVRLEAGACGRGEIRLKVQRQRRIADSDERWRWYRGFPPDSLRDRHRVVDLAPVAPLPLACDLTLRVPVRVDSVTAARVFRFSTYGPLAVQDTWCTLRPSEPCPVGPITIAFTTPVRGAEVLRRVHLLPQVPFTVGDTSATQDRWTLDLQLKPRARYLVVVDSGVTDVFSQRLAERFSKTVTTTAYTATVRYGYGRLLVERAGPRSLAVQHVNVDSLDVTTIAVPESLEARALTAAGAWDDLWAALGKTAVVRRIGVVDSADVPRVTALRLSAANTARPGAGTLQMVRVTSPRVDTTRDHFQPIAMVQITDLAVHAKIGLTEGAVWVTGVADGKPRAGARVTLYDAQGRPRGNGVTDTQGLARLTGLAPDTSQTPAGGEECEGCDWSDRGLAGYVAASLGPDRAVVAVNQWDPDLSPWQFNVMAAWGDQRRAAAATVFTERDIYRPGEPVYAKAIVRDGALGQLRPPAPARGDSLRWIFNDREEGVLKDTTVALSPFGTADQTLALKPDLPLGTYTVRLQRRSPGAGNRWHDAARVWYRVAEYRPPEFLVSVAADSGPRLAGDTVRAAVEARYLFGAPMARAAVSWYVRSRRASGWEVQIPNTEGFYVGETGWWWEEQEAGGGDLGPGQVVAQGEDTLDGQGRLALAQAAPPPARGKAAAVTFAATVTDVNRQTVTAGASVIVHPAAFYVAAKPAGNAWFWTAGQPRDIGIVAVRPDGRRLPGVAVAGALIRREWHRVRRERQGYAEDVGEWVSDTVGRCSVTTAAAPVTCRVVPPAGGSYTVALTATDSAGRLARTTFYRWATGGDFVPWNDESQFKMDVIPDKDRYQVGDTATVLFAAPFTNAEAWVTVEREGLIEQRRLRIMSGSTTLKFPITEAYAPNAYVAILVARGRSALPAAPDDPGRPTIRVGYAQLRVAPEVKRLTVDIQPDRAEYRPGDSARIAIRVRDAAGAPRRAEVTLWAVDQGVLSLTGFKTPDPIDLLYEPRGLGMQLASNLTSVAAQITNGEKGQRAPGGGGGMDVEGILRSRFQTTAFFLGSVVTDDAGRAAPAVRLPDNLTTFRVMAVAVTAGDRYGKGEAKLLVTRPLIARPALPRFDREGDQFTAGVVVNSRPGTTPTVTVQARAQGVTLLDQPTRTATLEAGRGREVRFVFRGVAGDTASFMFKVTAGSDADAVQTRVPIKLPYRPRAFEVAGTLADTATAEFVFPEPLDPARSRLEFHYGASPLALLRGYRQTLRIYPYYCTEQVASVALPLIALYQAEKQLGGAPLLSGDPRQEIIEAVQIVVQRQRDDGGIGLWSRADWTSPWLSAWAGRILLAARSAGVSVSDTVLGRLADYLSTQLHKPQRLQVPVAYFWEDRKAWLSEQVAALDFLSRDGRPDVPMENSLYQLGLQLSWEDRVLLAEILARRRQLDMARPIVAAVLRDVRVEGRRAVLPEESSAKYFYFSSGVRPAARLLSTLLAVDPSSRLVGPLVETVAQRGRTAAGEWWWWDTQDYAMAAQALLTYEWQRRQGAARPVRLTHGGQLLLQSADGGIARDTSFALTGLVETRPDGKQALRVSLASTVPGPAVFFYFTVREVPQERPVRPADAGIKVERWYERYDAPTPVTTVAEGDLVRVKVRITVPTLRNFVVVDDALPAGLEAVDLSLRTAGLPPVAQEQPQNESESEPTSSPWWYGYWDSGWWSPFDHRELRDDRVVFVATTLWPGTYTTTYVARATTPGVFVRPPTHAEEMYNPGVNGRSDGGVFTITPRSSTGGPR